MSGPKLAQKEKKIEETTMSDEKQCLKASYLSPSYILLGDEYDLVQASQNISGFKFIEIHVINRN